MPSGHGGDNRGSPVAGDGEGAERSQGRNYMTTNDTIPIHENPPKVEECHIKCPECQYELAIPFPTIEIANSQESSILLSAHKNDETCVSCPRCDSYLVPQLLGVSGITWKWV